ncbi:hypothetical protein [Reyranella sp.]|uniref:hypothetical protein n=1 Tax=Reyranella sp. TaxID=1929291 RepID=UPI003D0C9CB9
MARKSLDDLPEIFVSTSEISYLASKAVRAGKLRKLASRLYTKDLASEPESLVRRHLWTVIAGYFPGALIADRTAHEGAPAKDGSVFLISQGAQSDVALPGFTLRPRRGAPAQQSDLPFRGVLHLTSPARTLLDNLVPSRSRGSISRTLTKAEIEIHLKTVLRRSGDTELSRLRNDARALAPILHRERELAALSQLVGALLHT